MRSIVSNDLLLNHKPTAASLCCEALTTSTRHIPSPFPIAMVRTWARTPKSTTKSKKKKRGSSRPEWSAKFERLLSNRQRCQIFLEISIVMGDDASPKQVGMELALKVG